jgi:hypothetical protein
MDTVPPLRQMPRQTTPRAAAVGGEDEATKTKWSSFYWADTKLNYKGETLSECMNGYGCGGWTSIEKDMTCALVFLGPDRSFDHSWLLAIKHLDHEQGVSPLYERDTDTRHVPVDSPLGQQIVSALKQSVFEHA